jgi:hypothetical protein
MKHEDIRYSFKCVFYFIPFALSFISFVKALATDEPTWINNVSG